MPQYINLHLILDKIKGADHTYRAQLEHETKANPEPVEFTFALDSVLADGKDVRHYFDRIAELKAGTEELEVVGQALYERVFQKPLGELLQTWNEGLQSEQKLRLRLDIRTPELIAVPWELLHDARHYYFLVRRGISIVRFTGNARKDDVGLGPALRVLVVSANPGGQVEFNEDRYVEPVKALFAGYENVTVDVLSGAATTYEGLHEQLTEHKYDLFHFVGHGLYERGRGKIYVVGHQRRPKPVMGSDLAGWLLESGVQLACLCSCQTGKTGQHNPFRGVAQNLVGAGIAAVVAMQHDMPQDDARSFVEAFYKRLLTSESIDMAMHYARNALPYEQASWYIPVLYSQFDLGSLVTSAPRPVGTPSSTPNPPPPSTVRDNPFLPFGTPAPPERFCSQVHVLNDLIDALLQRRNTLIVGEPRMGKTSLLRYLTHAETMREHGLAAASHLHVFADVSALPEINFSVFWRDLLLRVGRQVPNDLKIRIEALSGSKNLHDLSIRRLLAHLRTTYELAFFLDEFDAVFKPGLQADFFDFLCTLNETDGITFIVSSRYRPAHYLWRGLGHAQRFFESCLIQELRPFTDEDYSEFLARHLQSATTPFTPADRRLLQRISGYYPYYLRAGCAVLFDAHGQGGRDQGALSQETLSEFWKQVAGSLADHWGSSDEQEQIMLAVLALRGQGRGEGPRIAREVLTYYCPNWQVTFEGLRQRALVLEMGGRVALFCRSFEAWILDTLWAPDGGTDAASAYAGWYQDLYGRSLEEEYPRDTAQRMRAVFGRVHDTHWELLTRWCRQAKYNDAALSVLAILPGQFSPQDYLRDR